jgi:hypothetical protein
VPDGAGFLSKNFKNKCAAMEHILKNGTNITKPETTLSVKLFSSIYF